MRQPTNQYLYTRPRSDTQVAFECGALPLTARLHHGVHNFAVPHREHVLVEHVPNDEGCSRVARCQRG